MLYKSDGTPDRRCSAYRASVGRGPSTSSSNSSTSYSSTSSYQTSCEMKFKSDGTPDMRCKAYRDMVSSGSSNPKPLQTSTPSYQPSLEMKMKSDGTPDKRCKAYKESQKSQSPPKITADEGSKSPKHLDPMYRTTGQTKHGSMEDGTEACHIFSHEILNCIFSHTAGRMYSDRVQEQIAREINSDKNLRIKTFDGNRYGSDGYSGDRYFDGMIIDAINSDNKVLTNQGAVDRLLRIWDKTCELDLPPAFKANTRSLLSELKDQNGKSIIWKNASIDGYD